MLQNRPETIFIPGFDVDAAHIIAQARELGFDGPILGGDGWEPSLMLSVINAGLMNNTFYCSNTSPADTAAGMQEFVAKFKKYSGTEPQQGTVLAYEATKIAVNALTNAGTLERSAVRDALEKTRDLPSVTGKITLDEKHNAIKSAVLIEMINGQEVFKMRIDP